MSPLVLVPQPRVLELSEASFQLSTAQRQAIEAFTLDASLPAGITLTIIEPPAGTAQATGTEAGAEAGVGTEVETKATAEPKHDWYRIKIGPGGIEVAATERRGCYYAFQTLRQILRQRRGGTLPAGRIEDWADYKVRGVLYDISRDRVPTMETLKQLIDMWAEWKYNQVQLYTEHSFAYGAHRTVWKDASPMTADEVRELNRYCRARGIELVPNQNSFGHMERWLQHPEYAHLAESPQGFYDPWGEFRSASSTLSPVSEGVLPFLSLLYDELLPCFESDYLNIGGDEPWELGKGRSKAQCEKKGLDRLYFDFLMKIYTLARSKGKRVQIYGDIIMKYPHLIQALPKDMVLINWGYEADHPFDSECAKIAAAEIPFYVCTGNSAWNSISGRWENARRNIARGAVQGKRFGAEGLIVSEWGDNGHWQQVSTGLPGFLYGACAAWNIDALTETQNSPSSFEPEQVLALHLFEGNSALAGAAMKLQRVGEQAGVRLHNATLPAVLLLDSVFPYYRGEYQQFRNYSFDKELELLDAAGALLDEADSSAELSETNRQFADELRWSQKLLRHGCRLGRLQLATAGLRVGEIAAAEREGLAADLEPLIGEYRQLWLRRSRPGGLSDSAARLESLLQSYRAER